MLTIEDINVVLPGLLIRHEVTHTFVASWIYDEVKLLEFKIAQFMNCIWYEKKCLIKSGMRNDQIARFSVSCIIQCAGI